MIQLLLKLVPFFFITSSSMYLESFLIIALISVQIVHKVENVLLLDLLRNKWCIDACENNPIIR